MASDSPKSAKARGATKNLLFQKVAIFVDAENIEMSSLKHHDGRTDYKKILEKVGDREIIRILYYKPIYKEISPEFESFWAGLGGEIRRPSKNADTFLVIDAVTMAEKIDVAIILGGDKDFQPLVWYLRSRGCRVEIWSWPETTSPEFQEASDFYMPLTEEFVIKAGASSASSSTPAKGGGSSSSGSSGGGGSSSGSSGSGSGSGGGGRSGGSSGGTSGGSSGGRSSGGGSGRGGGSSRGGGGRSGGSGGSGGSSSGTSGGTGGDRGGGSRGGGGRGGGSSRGGGGGRQARYDGNGDANGNF